jgi:hypothetical protein
MLSWIEGSDGENLLLLLHCWFVQVDEGPWWYKLKFKRRTVQAEGWLNRDFKLTPDGNYLLY